MSARLQFFCDIHGLRDEDVPIGADSLFGFDGEWYKFGICVPCDHDMIASFRALVLEHGIRLKKGELGGFIESSGRSAGKISGDATCLWCPDYTGTNAALGQHVNKVHGWPTMMAAYGDTCPMCGIDVKHAGIHATKHHDVKGTPQLFALAMQSGDPHGVVAARAKARPPKVKAA